MLNYRDLHRLSEMTFKYNMNLIALQKYLHEPSRQTKSAIRRRIASDRRGYVTPRLFVKSVMNLSTRQFLL